MKIFYQKGEICPKVFKSKVFLIMRLTFFLSFILTFSLLATTTYSQNTKMSLDVKNGTIKNVLKLIEEQSNFRFFYNSDLVDLDKEVRGSFSNKGIDEILQSVLTGTSVGYRVLENNFVVLSSAEMLQQITITGTVNDADGQPLPGVNVIIKGTMQGTVTDIRGVYSIQAPSENTTLVFSFIGFASQEILVGNQRAINVTLGEATRLLDEVVVVGYGTLKKESMTGAVAQVKGEVLESRPVMNVAQALQGQVANLNVSQSLSGDGPQGGAPGSTPSLNIRGYTGLGDMNGNSSGKSGEPLLIIDGVQGGDLRSVNMSDVESISVIKDAASAAIYGSSAPFGVIIINTKRGGKDRKPTITYNNNFGFAQPIHLPKMANSYEHALAWNDASVNASMAPAFSDENIRLIKDVVDGKSPQFVIPIDQRPGTDDWDWNNLSANTDWLDFYFKKWSFQQQHNVGASGGTEKSSYYLGLGYSDQDGMYNFSEEKFTQYRIRANISSDITSWLTVGFRGNFSRSTNDKPTDANGNFSIDDVTRKWPQWPTHNVLGRYHNSASVYQVIEGGRHNTVSDRATLTGEFIVKPLPGWDITGNFTYNANYQNRLIHYRTSYNMLPSGRLVPASNNPPSLRRETWKNQHPVINLFTTYEKQLNDHYFKALVGFTQEKVDNLNFWASNNSLYANDQPALALTYGTEWAAMDDASQMTIRGTFGRINYNYKEKYLIEFNGRYDGTSRFTTDHRMKFYPGVSAAWIASKESFWQPMEQYVNFLKIRASYGQLGDQSTAGNYEFFPGMPAISPSGTNDYPNNWIFNDARSSYIANPGLVNRNLTWITTSTLDFGADLAFFNQRLNVSFDWYNRVATNFTGPAVMLPALLGAGQPSVNNSELDTKGFELTVGWNDRILNNEFRYNVNLVFSDSKTKITKYPNPLGINTQWYEGQVLGDVWGYETYGLFQSPEEVANAASQHRLNSSWTPGDVRYVDRDGDGEIGWGDNTLDNPGDRKIIGSTAPRYSFGLSLGADYKGFDFSIFMQGIGKRDYWTSSNLFWGIHQGGPYNCSFLERNQDRWTPETPNGYFPKYYLNNQMEKNMHVQTRYRINTSYMRIKNLQVGYTIPTDISGKINCQRARIFVSVDNLATFTDYKDFDPELQTNNGRGGGKIYPLQRTWSFGLNVTF